MKLPIDHRKKVRHFDDPSHIRELTFSCYDRLPLLTNDPWRKLLADSVERALQHHGYRLVAFVFMPEHVHLLVYPASHASKIDAVLKAIKRPFSYRIKLLLTEADSQLLERLTIRQRPGFTTFRFWQEAPGYDRNLTNPKTVLTAIDYIHLNPVRRGLVKRPADWTWSSARYYQDDSRQQVPGLPTICPLPGASDGRVIIKSERRGSTAGQASSGTQEASE